MMKHIILPLVGISLALGCCHKACATMTLYSNGPISGQQTAWDISFPDLVTDSFTVDNFDHITGIDFGGWTVPGDTISQVDWMITPNVGFGIPYGSGTASVSATPFGSSTGSIPGSGYVVDSYSFSTGSVTLSPGTYYLSLFNGVTTEGKTAYWDQNSGPSSGYYDLSPVFHPTTGPDVPVESESFDIIGTVPEPSGYIPLGIGVLFIGALVYRRRQTAA